MTRLYRRNDPPNSERFAIVWVRFGGTVTKVADKPANET